VIKTRLGYHIVQVLERDPQRLLDPDARLVLQTKAIRQWLEARQAQSNIEILLP
jgi:parvulin-like peptidyl-prolyl isomerase